MTGTSGMYMQGAVRDTSRLQVLVVAIGDTTCGLSLEDVVEVLPAARLEPLAGAPAAVLPKTVFHG